jgi:hypothetical protein
MHVCDPKCHEENEIRGFAHQGCMPSVETAADADVERLDLEKNN